MFMTVAMTGLDQDMMGGTALGDAQNMGVHRHLMAANLLFLGMGALLWMHAAASTWPFPKPPTNCRFWRGWFVGPALGVAFLVGLLEPARPAGPHRTDHLAIDGHPVQDVRGSVHRKQVHLGLAVLLWLVIVAFNAVNDTSVVAALFTVAITPTARCSDCSGGHVHHLNRAPIGFHWRVFAPVAGYGLEHALTAWVGFSRGLPCCL